jgi:hypothetical protein
LLIQKGPIGTVEILQAVPTGFLRDGSMVPGRLCIIDDDLIVGRSSDSHGAAQPELLSFS